MGSPIWPETTPRPKILDADSEGADGVVGLDVVSSLLKVLVVFGLLVVTLRVLAKRQRGGGAAQKGGRRAPGPIVELLDQSRVGRSANVVAIKVGERVLLLGVTESEISTLADVSEDIDLTVDEDPDEPTGSVLDHAVDILRTGGFRTQNVSGAHRPKGSSPFGLGR